MSQKTLILTILTLIAFAANSILCRMALKADLIDPVSFTQIRLGAGVLFLAPFFYSRRSQLLPLKAGDWPAAFCLFLYAIAFSLAYVSLDAAVGALILFGTVQITMIGAAIIGGSRPGLLQWLGVSAGLFGLVYLTAPGLSAPPLLGAALMALAGIAWGGYSLLGRGAQDPVGATARNFILTTPFVVLLFLFGFLAPMNAQLSWNGIFLAILSGAIASGAGYVIWYSALKGLSGMNASIVQLAVPVIAALGGVTLLDEAITLRLVIASVLILGGIYLSIRFDGARG